MLFRVAIPGMKPSDARDAFLSGLEREGVRMISYPGSAMVRAVTHYGIEAADVDRSIDAVRRVLKDLGAGSPRAAIDSAIEVVTAPA